MTFDESRCIVKEEKMATQDIALGSAVHCWDGIAGRVARLVVDPASRRLTHLVVERGAGLEAVVVPIERLGHAVNEAPVLDMSVDDLAGLPVAAALPHAREVRNALLVESALVAAVTVALAHDARTAQAAIDVGCQGGSIILSGAVRTEVERDAALEVARGVKEAAVVLDELEVSPGAVRRRWLPTDLETFLAAAKGMVTLRRT
jgi:hypothetical protein